MNVHFSKNTDEWETPQKLFDSLNKEFHFNVDVCATEKNHKCFIYFDKEHDGLSMPWGSQSGAAWCNPPYSDLKRWVAKAWREAKQGATVVMLIPARTDTLAFHEYIWGQPNVEIRFIRGRLKFGKSKNTAPFPSIVVIFKPLKKDES